MTRRRGRGGQPLTETSEGEELEGSMGERQEIGDGNDKEVWVKMVQEMKHSINMTQFDLQHHLQETQENLLMG
jgi:hypothetical protein